MVTVSSTLRAAVWAARASGRKQHVLARAAGLPPTVFSAVINDIVPVRAGDERVLRIAAIVGVRPSEAFTVISTTDDRPEVRQR